MDIHLGSSSHAASSNRGWPGAIACASTQRSQQDRSPIGHGPAGGSSALSWVGETQAEVAGSAFGEGSGEHGLIDVELVVDLGCMHTWMGT